VRTIAVPAASDSLGEDLFGFIRRAGLTSGIRQILPPLIGQRRGLNGPDADGLVFQYAAAEQAFNGRLLVGREIFALRTIRNSLGGNVSESNRSTAFGPLGSFEDCAHHRVRHVPGPV
jgi:hypothetical protein